MKAKKITALLLAAALAATSFTGCGINKDATVATLDDTQIKLGLVNFMIRLTQAGYDDMYIQYMGEGYWNETYSGDATVLDNWKDNAIETVHDLYTLKAHMSDYDVEITDDEQSSIDDAAAQFIEDNSKEALDEMGATEDIVKEYMELMLIRSKMYDAIVVDADSDVTDEEANMAAYTMVSFDFSGYYDSSYNYVSYSDDEVAEIQANAQSAAAEVAEGTSLEDAATNVGSTASSGTYATYNDPETAEDDDAIDETESADDTESTDSTENTEDTTDDTEDTEAEEEDTEESVYTTNSIDSEVEDVLDSLEEGETSGLIETDSCYYIVRLDSKTDEEATETNRETVQGNKEDKYYNETLSGWQDEETWTVNEKQLDKIKIHNYFTTVSESTEDTESTETVEETVDGTEVTDTTEDIDTTESTYGADQEGTTESVDDTEASDDSE